MWIGIEHGKGPATDLTYMFMKQKALYESRAYNYTDSETRHLSRLKYQRQAIKNKVSVCVWGGGGEGVGRERGRSGERVAEYVLFPTAA